MKNILAISLLSIFLFSTIVSSTIWGDMAKINNLIEHYKEHKKVDSNTSFWSFIDLHYGKDFQKHQTAHDHSKLPLKNTTPSVFAFIISDLDNPPFSISASCIESRTQQELPHFYKRFVSQNLTDIWQPPRSC